MSVQSNAVKSASSRCTCSRTHVSATEADSRIVVPSVLVTRTAPRPAKQRASTIPSRPPARLTPRATATPGRRVRSANSLSRHGGSAMPAPSASYDLARPAAVLVAKARHEPSEGADEPVEVLRPCLAGIPADQAPDGRRRERQALGRQTVPRQLLGLAVTGQRHHVQAIPQRPGNSFRVGRGRHVTADRAMGRPTQWSRNPWLRTGASASSRAAAAGPSASWSSWSSTITRVRNPARGRIAELMQRGHEASGRRIGAGGGRCRGSPRRRGRRPVRSRRTRGRVPPPAIVPVMQRTAPRASPFRRRTARCSRMRSFASRSPKCRRLSIGPHVLQVASFRKAVLRPESPVVVGPDRAEELLRRTSDRQQELPPIQHTLSTVADPVN